LIKESSSAQDLMGAGATSEQYDELQEKLNKLESDLSDFQKQLEDLGDRSSRDLAILKS